MDQEVPTPGSQIPELSCILPQVPSVPFQTLGFRIETLYNLIPTKFMGNYHWDLGWFLHCLPRSHHPFSQHGFKKKIWLLLLFGQETWDRNDWCRLGGPSMSSPGITGGACDPSYLRSAFPKKKGLAESHGILSVLSGTVGGFPCATYGNKTEFWINQNRLEFVVQTQATFVKKGNIESLFLFLWLIVAFLDSVSVHFFVDF